MPAVRSGSGSSVRLPASSRWPRSWSCPFLFPGRAVCPALGTGDGGHRGMPPGRQGQAVEPTKSALDQLAGCSRLRCRVGWPSPVVRLPRRAAVAPAWPQVHPGTTRAPPMGLRRRSDLRCYLVGATGFEPVTPRASAKSRYDGCVRIGGTGSLPSQLRLSLGRWSMGCSRHVTFATKCDFAEALLSGRMVFPPVRASAERGRVQGPGRAEADLGPRTIAATGNSCR